MDASEQLIATGAFVAQWPAYRLAGTGRARPAALTGNTCLGCGSEVVGTVLDRFSPAGAP